VLRLQCVSHSITKGIPWPAASRRMTADLGCFCRNGRSEAQRRSRRLPRPGGHLTVRRVRRRWSLRSSTPSLASADVCSRPAGVRHTKCPTRSCDFAQDDVMPVRLERPSPGSRCVTKPHPNVCPTLAQDEIVTLCGQTVRFSGQYRTQSCGRVSKTTFEWSFEPVPRCKTDRWGSIVAGARFRPPFLRYVTDRPFLRSRRIWPNHCYAGEGSRPMQMGR